MIKRILVDLSDTERADGILRHAVELGCRHQAELTVVVASSVAQSSGIGPLQEIAAAAWARELQRQHIEDAREHVGAALESLRESCVSRGVPFSIVEQGDDPFESTVERFRYHDVFVCGSHATFDQAHLEDGSEELVRLVEEGVRPLLAVSDDFRPIQRVLIAQSAAIDSARTLKRFVRFRPWPDMSLKIVAFRDAESDPSSLLTDASHYCRRHGVEPEVEVLDGPICQELLHQALEWDADLIVIGNSDHSRLSRWFFGGTVMDIIRESDRSLFLSQ